MNVIKAIKERRSIRSYKDKRVDRETINEILEASRWAPSWANFQVARYTIVENEDIISRLADEGVSGFIYNINTLSSAHGVAVISYVKGKSGRLDESGYATSKGDVWEVFDAGIACQTFCLAAHAKGVGTCVMGVIDEERISEILGLPDGESVATMIVYGYERGDHPDPTPRKEVEEIARYID